MEWQPIETAIKNSDAILVVNGEKGGNYTSPFEIGIAEYFSGKWISTTDRDVSVTYNPTHWMPLPEPPK